MLLTSITPQGRFRVGKHAPSYRVANLREQDHLCALGFLPDHSPVDNRENFPQGDVHVEQAHPIYEILNPLPFRGCTFIDSAWASARAADPGLIRIQRPLLVSLRAILAIHCPATTIREIITQLPLPLRYELAATSTDP